MITVISLTTVRDVGGSRVAPNPTDSAAVMLGDISPIIERSEFFVGELLR